MSGRRFVPGARRTAVRATTRRRASNPIATITLRNIAHRAISSWAVTAVAEMRGIGNCGAGPGLGPIAYVNAPWTGWPSTEIARQ